MVAAGRPKIRYHLSQQQEKMIYEEGGDAEEVRLRLDNLLFEEVER